jgi:hypothetical protein
MIDIQRCSGVAALCDFPSPFHGSGHLYAVHPVLFAVSVLPSCLVSDPRNKTVEFPEVRSPETPSMSICGYVVKTIANVDFLEAMDSHCRGNCQ